MRMHAMDGTQRRMRRLGWGFWDYVLVGVLAAVVLAAIVFATLFFMRDDEDAAPIGAANGAAAENGLQVTDVRDFGDWRFSCLEDGDRRRRCAIVQQHANQETQRPVFAWQIFRNADGGLVGIWQTPQQVLLNRGLRIEIPDKDPIVIPFENCNDTSCVATANLASGFLQTLETAESISVTFVLRNQQAVQLAISTDGLADGLAALQIYP